MVVAVIADIVGSRRAVDRSSVQAEIETAVRQAAADLPVEGTPLTATVGDEFQAVYPDLPTALASLLLVQLALPDTAACRFGVGVGDIRPVHSAERELSDGPGWWSARAAIDTVHSLQQRAAPSARTHVVFADDENADMADVRFANAYLFARDQLVVAMSERARRLTYGRCLGRTQAAIARSEGITQSAVSQALATSGSAAVVEGFALLVKERRE